MTRAIKRTKTRILLLAATLLAVLLVRITMGLARRKGTAPRQATVQDIRAIDRVLYVVFASELKQATTNWQRWAEFPPCRHNTSPTSWERGQVGLDVVAARDDASIDVDDILAALKESWSLLNERVQYCFEAPNFKTISNLTEYIEQQTGPFLYADCRLWPVRDNWLNALAHEAASSNYRTMGFEAPDGEISLQSLYNFDQGEYVPANNLFVRANGSIMQVTEKNPRALFVIADHNTIEDDYW